MSELLQKVNKIDDIAHCICDEAQINATMDRLGAEVSADFADKNPIVLCVMIGGMMPAADLLKRLNFPLQVEFVQATRYQGGVEGGQLHWLVEPRLSLKDRHILIVEDILDKGLTLQGVVDYCKSKGAASIKTFAFVDKKTERDPNGVQSVDYAGIEIEDKFVIGYGLDFEEYFRNLMGIYMVDEPMDGIL